VKKKQRGYYTASFILALSDTISSSLPDTSHPPMTEFVSLNKHYNRLPFNSL